MYISYYVIELKRWIFPWHNPMYDSYSGSHETFSNINEAKKWYNYYVEKYIHSSKPNSIIIEEIDCEGVK